MSRCGRRARSIPAEQRREVGPEQHLDGLGPRPQLPQPDAERRADGAARPVRADHEPGADAVTRGELGAHPVRPDLQADQPRPEPDLAAVPPDGVGQDRLDQILRADQRHGRADPQRSPAGCG